MNAKKSELFSILLHNQQLNNWRRILTVPFPASFNASTLYNNPVWWYCISISISMLSQRQQCWTNLFALNCVMWITHLIWKSKFYFCIYIICCLDFSAQFHIKKKCKKCSAQKVESNHWACFISYGFEVRTPYQWRSSTHIS